MNQKVIAFAAVAVLILYWVGGSFFTTEEDKIFRTLNQLEDLLSKSESENAIEMASKANTALKNFSDPIEIKITYEDENYQRTLSITDRERFKQSIAGMKFKHKWFRVSFEDTEVLITGSKADSNGRFRIKFRDPVQGRVYMLFSLNMQWAKSVEDQWIINRIEASPIPEEEE